MQPLELPTFDTLRCELEAGNLHLWLQRPSARNAMSLKMVEELLALFERIEPRRDVRALVIRGSDGNFCAGGDIKDMASARATPAGADTDPFFELNRAFGRMITRANRLPQVVVAVLEGAVLGGGFGLACVSDVAIAVEGVQFGLPETGLGIPPAQIAPFVVKRIGLTEARRLMLLGSRFGAEEALHLGLVHYHSSADALDEQLAAVLAQVKRCAPEANATTKSLLLATETMEHEALLDYAAQQFAAAVRSDEGGEGTLAFIQKRPPSWAQ
ncbi:enoyl-CoA hydratase/isomerase family protein [Aestuariirhabdus litorea]|uniref:Enoyl-CoA hydratase/isomerase family protein n=1 Tax=Aestuariirhabdus litorea TaxID=2528527 RepID=A0A3P3VRK0_9GAMM|nr:enoyl-CoA hydratase-related protein [Aestuariirhabdus litorea]RRJ84618.1 enoyl-CoA hydratase/isomerase family protein [Aestuariirhabdus litorea]RWW97844.1 enoyl-CoA hydratase/isomerase family protein [Endozoicomonadaceae bacterium GTF-13]